MQNIDLRTLVPALVFLITFIGSAVGHPLNEMNVTQLVTASVSLIGVIVGIFQTHRKTPPVPDIKTIGIAVDAPKPQPPAQP